MESIEYLLSRARQLAGFVLLAGCSTAPMLEHPVTPAVFARPLIPSPPGGGCLPFASLVPAYPHRPETARVADVLLRAGYVIVQVEHGRTTWRCGRAAVAPLGMQRVPAQESAQAQALSEAPAPVGVENAPSTSAYQYSEPTYSNDITADASRALAESLLNEPIRRSWRALLGSNEGESMDWITEHIAIGNRLDAHNADLRNAMGFRAVISLDGSMSDENALALGYDDCVTAQLNDGPGNNLTTFKYLVRTLFEMVDNSPPVLVHCHAGRSRSVTLVAAYLAVRDSLASQEAYRRIAERREICVMDGLTQLVDACRLTYRIEGGSCRV